MQKLWVLKSAPNDINFSGTYKLLISGESGNTPISYVILKNNKSQKKSHHS